MRAHSERRLRYWTRWTWEGHAGHGEPMQEPPRIGILASMGRWPAPLNPGSPPCSLCEMRSRASTWKGPDTGELHDAGCFIRSEAWRMQLEPQGSRLHHLLLLGPNTNSGPGQQPKLARLSTHRVPLPLRLMPSTTPGLQSTINRY